MHDRDISRGGDPTSNDVDATENLGKANSGRPRACTSRAHTLTHTHTHRIAVSGLFLSQLFDRKLRQLSATSMTLVVNTSFAGGN